MATAPAPSQGPTPARIPWRSLWAGTPRPGLGCGAALGLLLLLGVAALLYQLSLIGLRWPWPGQLAGWLGLLLGAGALLWAVQAAVRACLRFGLRGVLVRLVALVGLAVLAVGLIVPTGATGFGHWQLTLQRVVTWPASGFQAVWTRLVEAPGEVQFAATGRRPPLVVPGASWEENMPPPPLVARVTADEVAPGSASPRPDQTTPAPATVIVVGATARVVGTDGAALRARATPSRDATILARFAEGAVVEVIDGPVEAEGLTWWRVRGTAGEGWCAANFLAPQ